MKIDYKAIIRSRKMRLLILRILCFIPDKNMICAQYKLKTGRKLNLDNPKRFTEKIQCYKLNYRNSEMIRCVDKFDVRGYVIEKGLESILIPIYGVFSTVDEIDWNKLPEKFVMKDTLGGGGNSVIIVEKKTEEQIETLKNIVKKWVKINAHIRDSGREWPYYSGNNHRVLFEELLEANIESGGLIDYKFFCFNGKVEFLYVIADRKIGQGAGVGIFSATFDRLPVKRKDENYLERNIDKPSNFEEMKRIAEKLAGDFPEVRVDLYNLNGKIYFGELTFFDGSGYMEFEPDEYDYRFGDLFNVY